MTTQTSNERNQAADAPAPKLLKVAIRPIGDKGRGLVALTAIAAGEMIDEAPSVEIDEATCDAIEPTVLDDFYFAHPTDDTAGLVVLGLPSLCNHSDEPNADTTQRHDERLGWLIGLRAVRAIEAGEEVTRRYACPVWF